MCLNSGISKTESRSDYVILAEGLSLAYMQTSAPSPRLRSAVHSFSSVFVTMA